MKAPGSFLKRHPGFSFLWGLSATVWFSVVILAPWGDNFSRGVAVLFMVSANAPFLAKDLDNYLDLRDFKKSINETTQDS